MKKKIDNYIKQNTTNIIRDILDLVKIRSVTGDEEKKREALNLFLEKANDMGFKTKNSSLNNVGIVKLGEGAETVGVLVHVDVVGEGDVEKWTFPPFEGKVAKGFIWGRGVVDNKGPAIMCLYALKAIKDLHIPLKKKILLIVGTCEESEWKDIETFKKEFEVPDYGFTPDGDFPIFNKEKGYCDVILDFNEPCRDMIEKLNAGDSANTIPSKAVFKIKNQEEMVFNGISCHSSAPALGINAISKLAVEQSFRTELNFIRFLNDFLAKDYYGSKFNIDTHKFEQLENSSRTSMVPTMIELTEKGVRLNINLRIAFGVSEDSIKKAFEAFSGQYEYKYELSDYLSPMEVDEKEAFLQTMAKVYEDYGFTASFQSAVGTSYAKSMEHFVSWGPVFETEPSCAHMENERISVDAMIIATQMYALFLERDAGAYDKLKNVGDNLTSLQKALYLLELFTMEPYRYDVPTLVTLTGMNRTTIYRTLTTLERMEMLARDEDTKSYILGPMACKMGKIAEELK